MHPIAAPVVLLLLALHLSEASLGRRWMLQEAPLRLEDDEPVVPFFASLSRQRRSQKVTLCGGKVWKMVMATCGGECTATETDIATRCCEAKCTMEEIVSSCCPS